LQVQATSIEHSGALICGATPMGTEAIRTPITGKLYVQ